MKIENGKIVEILEYELFNLYCDRGWDELMSFDEYIRCIKENTGCIVIET